MLTQPQYNRIEELAHRWLGDSQGFTNLHKQVLNLVLEIIEQQHQEWTSQLNLLAMTLGTDLLGAKREGSMTTQFPSPTTPEGTGITVTFNLPLEPGKASAALDFLQTVLTRLKETLPVFSSDAQVGDTGPTAQNNSVCIEPYTESQQQVLEKRFGDTTGGNALKTELSRNSVDSYEAVRAATGPHSPDCKFPVHACVCKREP